MTQLILCSGASGNILWVKDAIVAVVEDAVDVDDVVVNVDVAVASSALCCCRSGCCCWCRGFLSVVVVAATVQLLLLLLLFFLF